MHELDSLVTILLHHFGVMLPDYMAMLLFVMVGTLVVFGVGTRRMSVDKPGVFQQILELLTETVGKFLDDIIGHDGRKYMAPIGTFAVLILISNLMGLVPGLMPPTGNIIVTISLALCSFVTYNFLGIRAQGFSYIKHFMGPVLVLTPLFFPIEIISHLARPLSLSIRLFGNTVITVAGSSAPCDRDPCPVHPVGARGRHPTRILSLHDLNRGSSEH
jgi:F-type H+-transporting ATPase subunit a